MNRTGSRIQSIDALRGFCVVLMCIHHLLYDICAFLGAPWWLFTNPVLDTLHYLFAGCFILLCGVSSRFSHSNIRRGLKTVLVALALSAVTWLVDRFCLHCFGEEAGVLIVFGVLHLLGFCMLFYGLTGKLWEKIPGYLLIPLCVLGILLTARFVRGIFGYESHWLFPLGMLSEGFHSADYFPIIPWIFVFLIGTWLGGLIQAGKLPAWFYNAKFPFFPAAGRHALLVYILHQPILAGLTLFVGWILGIL